MPNECYICMEQCNRLSSCKCKNLFLHEKCQLNHISISKENKCTICKTNYNNVIIKKTKVFKIDNHIYIFMFITIGCGAIVFYASGVALLCMYLEYSKSKNVIMLIVGASCIIIGVFNMYFYSLLYKYIKINNIRLFRFEEKITPTIINFPQNKFRLKFLNNNPNTISNSITINNHRNHIIDIN